MMWCVDVASAIYVVVMEIFLYPTYAMSLQVTAGEAAFHKIVVPV